jgi:NMT1-like family
MESNTAKASMGTVLAGGLGFAVYAVTLQAGSHTDGRIVLATGNPHYQQLAETYRPELERYGVRLEFKDLEGFATLKALADAKSEIHAGFVKGGLVGSMQGRLATEKAKGRHVEYAKLQSLGRLFYEPIWVFTRADTPLQSLRDLNGKRIMLGTRDSGSRRIATQLLRANGISPVRDDPKFINEELSADAGELLEGKADAAILILPADDDKIQALLHVPAIRLMDFSAEAEAYDNRFPALTKLVMRTGSVEFKPLIPSADITLLATSVALVVKPELDASLASLLTQAIMNNPKPGFDKNGDPVLFYKPGEFPSPSDPEFEVPKEARQIYKTNELPFLLRLVAPFNKRIGLPYNITAYTNAHAAKLILLIPALAVLVPLIRFLPVAYAWNVRRRLLYWYRQLKALERSLDSGGAKYDLAAHQAEVERIDSHVRRLRVPLYFSSQLYDLRGHIDLVRHRIAQRPPQEVRIAAE